MSLKALLEGRVEDYVAENRDEPGAYWHFIHIPKTAGSSFREELATRLKPQVNLFLDRHRADAPHRDRLVDLVKTFRGSQNFSECRFASGHIPRVLARPLFNSHRPTRIITMLRDPVERVISDFRYQRTDAHVDRDLSIKRFPTFESYVRTPGMQNKMYKFLREGPKQTVEQSIASVERNFAFVGFTEDYAESMKLLFRLIGTEGLPKVYARKTQSVPENEIGDLDKWRPIIRELNALDLAIYEHFHARLVAAIRCA